MWITLSMGQKKEDNILKQFCRLTCFEWKKIWKRKSTWITLGILLLFYLVMDGAYLFGSTYIDGEFLETRVEGTEIDIENGRRLSGRKIDDELLKEIQQVLQTKSDTEDKRFKLTEEYQTKIRPYEGVYKIVNEMLYGSSVNLKNGVTQEQLYDIRQEKINLIWDQYHLSNSEKSYWQKKEDHLEKPITYEYADGYSYLIDMSGVYRVCLMTTFLIAICMSIVFTEEHGRKTDQLILCSKLGRRQIYYAKIAAGSLFSFVVTVFCLLCTVFGAFMMFGMDGFNAKVQLIVSYYSESITMGQILLIMTGILLLSSVVTAIFTMVLSEITSSNMASMSVVVALLFIARLVPIPNTYRVLSQLWNLQPINLLKYDAGFFDLRLVPVFGMKFTIWQVAPVFYVILGILLLMLGKRVYCRYQVQGR